MRFRTLGCWPLTGAVLSEAQTLPEIIEEMLISTTSERQGRLIDSDQSASMELKSAKVIFSGQGEYAKSGENHGTSRL